MAEKVWIEQTTQYWKPEKEGDTIVGVYIENEPSKYGEVPVLKKEDGTKWVLPRLKVLTAKFTADLIGKELMVKYLGKEFNQKTKQEYKNFAVFVAREKP